MNAVQVNADASPQIELQQTSLLRDSAGECWRVGWQIANNGSAPLEVYSVKIPHGQFRSSEQCFAPAMVITPGGSTLIESLVHCDEPQGLVTENAFLIFEVHWRGEPWRVFVRIRVTVQARREPRAEVELISTQRVGFSGVPN